MDIPDSERAIEHRPARQEWNDFIADIEAMISRDPDARFIGERQVVKWHDDTIMNQRYVMAKSINTGPGGQQYCHYTVTADDMIDFSQSVISFRDNSLGISRFSGPIQEWAEPRTSTEDEQENYRLILGMFLASNSLFRPFK